MPSPSFFKASPQMTSTPIKNEENLGAKQKQKQPLEELEDDEGSEAEDGVLPTDLALFVSESNCSSRRSSLKVSNFIVVLKVARSNVNKSTKIDPYLNLI